MSKENKILTNPELLKFPEDYKITIDIDGVLAYSLISVLNKFNQDLKTNYLPKDINGFYAISDLAKKHGKSKQESFEIEKRLWYSPDVLFQSAPVPGSYTFMERLIKSKVEYYVTTSRINSCEQATLDWLRIWMPFVDEGRIFFSGKENPEISRKLKIQKIIDINPNFHIEDSLSQSQQIIKATEKLNIILIPHAYNTIDSNEDSNERLFVMKQVANGPNLWPVYRFLKKHLVAQSY